MLCFFVTQSVQDASSSRRLHLGLKKPPHRQTDTAEPLRNSPPETSSKRTISNTAPQGAAELQCPRCLTTYDDEHAAEYLNHWDECAKLWVSHLTDFSQGTERTEDKNHYKLADCGMCDGVLMKAGARLNRMESKEELFFFLSFFSLGFSIVDLVDVKKVACGIGLRVWLWVGHFQFKGLLTWQSQNADGLDMKRYSILSIFGL